jgi:hypothetical protein
MKIRCDLTIRKIRFREPAFRATVVQYSPDLRPGNRGIGVSVAVAHEQFHGEISDSGSHSFH